MTERRTSSSPAPGTTAWSPPPIWRGRDTRCSCSTRASIPGGGAASEELLGPGYVIDSCSTGHTLIQTNPLLVDDELGLLALRARYIEPDPFAHVGVPDGEQLTMWLDLERSCEELARFSRRDAESYRRLISDYDSVKHLFGRSRFSRPGSGPRSSRCSPNIPTGGAGSGGA